jgi:ankyrin repeat protein
MQHNLKVLVRIAAVSASILTFVIGCTTPTYAPSPTAERRASGLINAAAAGDLLQVKSLIAAKADVNAKTDDGETALMYAVWGDHVEVVQALLAAGADVKAKNNNGETPLIVASKRGHAGVVQALLAAGADVNAKNNNGETALKIAQVAGHTRMVKLLRQAGGKE